MSYHPYRVQSIEDEKRLLEKMLQLESKIRFAREKERYLKTSQSAHYSKIFLPITSSLKHLQTKKPAVQLNSSTSTDQSIDVMHDTGKDVELDENKNIPGNDPGDLFKLALASVPTKSRDDGIFGLNVTTKRIGDFSFVVDGNTLHIMDHEEQVKSFLINDINLWKLLLVKRPNDIGLKLKDARDRNTPALDEFIRIVQDLHLVSVAKKDQVQIKNRAKYKLLPKVGHGFLFTSTRPRFLKKNLIHPSVVVIPSDKKGLLRSLVQSVAELRSGNTSMQNVVVPLAKEAKRLKILPPGLLSPKEMTWVYA